MSRTHSRDKILALIAGILLVAIILLKAAHPSYTIPTPAMAQTVRVGDIVLASRPAYGWRIPFTGIRLPATDPIQRGDIVVFHFPAGDTVLDEQPDRTYYDLVREAAYTGRQLEGHISTHSIYDRTTYLKRCVAVAGDKVEIKDGTLYINDQPENDREHSMKAWSVMLAAAPTEESIEHYMHDYEAEFMMALGPDSFAIRMTPEAAARFKKAEGRSVYWALSLQGG